MTTRIRARDGRDVEVEDAAVRRLADGLRGDLLTPGTPAYDAARTIWNAMIDRHPALVARCAGAADVVRAVRFAREHDLLVAVRGGGHNIAGNAVCDGGLVIDLSALRDVHVDPIARTARVGPGATLADFDDEAQAFGLATPLGINSTTGVAGLTLGGGFGWLTRRYGLTVDNLISADVVTADGELLRASEREHPDLFWGLRGGGGNFGVVTSFEFQLHPVGPEVLAGLVVHPFDDAAPVLRQYRDVTAGLADETTVWAVLRKAPPLPFLPEAWHGREVVVLAFFHAGDPAEGARALEPLRRFGRPLADVVGPTRYAAWQQTFDPLLAPGARNYWKSHNFDALPDGALDTMIDYAGRLPSPETEIFLGQVGGAAARLPADSTAYPHRQASFAMNVHGRWRTRDRDEACIGWARDFFGAMTPFATGGVYVNFLTADEARRVGAAYGPNWDRLVALKARWDPENRFRMNQNIPPVARS